MGNEKAWEYWCQFFGLCKDYLTSEENIRFPDSLPYEIVCSLVERCYNELVGLAFSQNARLAFQVLGDFLMSHGAEMTEDLKKIILKNTLWRNDRSYLKDKKDRLERRKYLFDFREKIIKYESGVIIKVPIESVTQVCDRELKKAGEDYS